MSITATVTKQNVSNSIGGCIEVTGYITCSGTYAAGGFTVDLSSYMTTLYAILASPSTGGYVPAFDVSSLSDATGKLKVLRSTTGAPADLVDVTASEVHTEVYAFIAKGSAGAA